MKALSPELETSLRGVAGRIKEKCNEMINDAHPEPGAVAAFKEIGVISDLLTQGLNTMNNFQLTELLQAIGRDAYGRHARQGLYDVHDPGRKDPIISPPIAGMAGHLLMAVVKLTSILMLEETAKRTAKRTKDHDKIIGDTINETVELLSDIKHTFKL